MVKLLEKAIKDAVDDGKCFFGTKEALSSIKNSKLIVLSRSILPSTTQKIVEAAKSAKVPTLNYNGSSVELGRLCGAQFRISAVSLKALSDTNLKAIIKDAETEKQA
ncbi:MAG: ribosomal L7Ae/L30e/S12e/Gadd45 family protein [Thaumarchaeota archaeon]|nr:ribosomal L7Ae/L30e/S12e/Gadd45 family protein [Nitrososphaerota archaeon]MDE1873228.1 ribosomal L7Ae/L30e/S12e/Gadd45 family protein [Nitrososphaerota archaeon]